MSALQTNINTLMSATSFEELRNRMVAILTTIADTPPGSGITEVTSVDGSIAIDNTDPSAPDLSARKISSTASGNTASFIASAGSRLQADFNGYRPLFLSGTEEADSIIGFFAKANTSAGSLQAAAIADATDSTDVITQLNTLLAAMRAYGLIAE